MGAMTRFGRAAAFAALATVGLAGSSGCTTGGVPPGYVSGTYTVDATVAPVAVDATVGSCTVTGDIGPASVPGATVTVPPIEPLDLTKPVITLDGVSVSVPEATVPVDGVTLSCDGAPGSVVTAELHVPATAAVRTATNSAGNTATLSDPVVTVDGATLSVDGGALDVPLPALGVGIGSFELVFSAAL